MELVRWRDTGRKSKQVAWVGRGLGGLGYSQAGNGFRFLVRAPGQGLRSGRQCCGSGSGPGRRTSGPRRVVWSNFGLAGAKAAGTAECELSGSTVPWGRRPTWPRQRALVGFSGVIVTQPEIATAGPDMHSRLRSFRTMRANHRPPVGARQCLVVGDRRQAPPPGRRRFSPQLESVRGVTTRAKLAAEPAGTAGASHTSRGAPWRLSYVQYYP
jgi:hypothetical protein